MVAAAAHGRQPGFLLGPYRQASSTGSETGKFALPNFPAISQDLSPQLYEVGHRVVGAVRLCGAAHGPAVERRPASRDAMRRRRRASDALRCRGRLQGRRFEMHVRI